MTRGYNELVGIQAMFSKVFRRYSLTHYYRQIEEGEASPILTMRGYDMRRHSTIGGLKAGLRNAYAPAIVSIWHQVTEGYTKEYYQLHPDSSPQEIELEGEWEHWAER